MKYYYLEPEVAGGLGENTVADTSIHPPRVSRLHFELEGWLGDDIIESFPCFLVTDHLMGILQRSGLSGFHLDDAEVTASSEFVQLYPERELPKFYWLRVDGVAERDDFGVAEDHRLLVSERVMSVLEQCSIRNADIEDR